MLVRFTPPRHPLLDELQQLVPHGSDLDIGAGAVSIAHTAELAQWRASGRIGRLRIITNAGPMLLHPEHAQAVQQNIGANSIRIGRFHAKFAAWDGGGLLTSANLTRPTSAEQYEALLPEEAGALHGLMDAAWAVIPAGCGTPSNAKATRGTLAAMAAAAAATTSDRIIWHVDDGDIDTTTLTDRLTVVTAGRVGTAGIVADLARGAGRGAEVVASTWFIGGVEAELLARACAARHVGRLEIHLPTRYTRRSGTLHHYVATMRAIGDCVRWKKTHAKVAVVLGSRASFVVTGSSNLSPNGELNVIRIARVNEEDACELIACLRSVPDDEQPEPPPQDIAPALPAAGQAPPVPVGMIGSDFGAARVSALIERLQADPTTGVEATLVRASRLGSHQV